MLSPEATLVIGIICGIGMGYPAGFYVARMIYRSKVWPAPSGG